MDRIEEPESLGILRDKIDKLMTRIDVPELLLEADQISDFTDECTHRAAHVCSITKQQVFFLGLLLSVLRPTACSQDP